MSEIKEHQNGEASSTRTNGNSDINNRFLCFSLGKEEYAVPLLSVKEVIAMPEYTPVPQVPNYFLGIMNLRGLVVSIIDLRTKLSIKPSEGSDTAVIICDVKPNPIGVVVDSINSVVHPREGEISDKPEIQSQKNTEYIQGVYREKGKLILLLDIAKTLNLQDQQVIAKQVKPKAA